MPKTKKFRSLNFRSPVDTPDGHAGTVEIRYPLVRVIFHDGNIKTYDVDDCLFPAGETNAQD